MFQNPPWMPETADRTEPYIFHVLSYGYIFSLKGSTMLLLFGISELPPIILLGFGATGKQNEDDLSTSSAILPQLI